MNNKNILIIDDSPRYSAAVSIQLQCEGFQAHRATKQEEAIELVKKNDYYMILVDMFLTKPTDYITPDQYDGIIITKLIKEIKPKIPIIMITGYSNQFAHQEFFDAGGLDIIDKVFDFDTLKTVIQKCSEFHKKRSAT